MSNHNALIHDIRNPLNNISMNAELGKMMLSDSAGKNDKLEEIFSRIVDQCQECSQALSHLKRALDNQHT